MRTWTLDEARAALPGLRASLAAARQHLDALEEVRDHIRDLRIVHGDDVAEPGGAGHEEYLSLMEQFKTIETNLRAAVGDIEAVGVHIKGIHEGLIDFPADLGGRPVLLCWRFGEDEIGHYHPMDGGFAGRRPIPRLEG